MTPRILMIGAFDTKGAEFAFLRERLLEQGCGVIAMNIGVLGGFDAFPAEIGAAAVAAAGGASLEALRAADDRGAAMKAMAEGAAALLPRLYGEGRFDGAIGMGGTGGSSVIAAGLRALPLGVPKVLVSTAAGGDVSAFVGTKDVVMYPSIVDVAGINRISRVILTRAAGAVAGMARAAPAAAAEDRPIVAASMFGNTTACVTRCSELLAARGYEVLTFHAIGSGGRTMESLVEDGAVDGVLDITTTEWADELCGGVFSAGPDRLSAPGRRGVPHLIVPGCLDMVNFGGIETVPARYHEAERSFYAWNPAVTLMRTSRDENWRLGEVFAEKANAARGPVAFLIPQRGVSILDGDGQRFCDREADAAFVAALRLRLDPGIPVVELDCNINDPAFSERAVELMLELMARKRGN